MANPTKAELAKNNQALSKFKFEANISVFGTDVELKPTEGDEIGYRAPAGSEGIDVARQKIIDAGLIEKDGTAAKLIPTNTYIKTIVYNRKTKKVEFAVKAEFTPGPMDEKQLKVVEKSCTPSGGVLDGAKYTAALINELKIRKIYTSANDTMEASALEAALKEAPEGFILNKYPDIFRVNSVSIYVGPDSGEPASDTPTPAPQG